MILRPLWAWLKLAETHSANFLRKNGRGMGYALLKPSWQLPCWRKGTACLHLEDLRYEPLEGSRKGFGRRNMKPLIAESP